MEDIISIDVGVLVNGWIGDNARTVMIGAKDPEVIRLVKTAELSLDAAIAQAVEGNRISDISHAIERTATCSGFSVVKEFVGHGVGRSMHEEPQIPNYGTKGTGIQLRSGMTLAIEPMVNLGKPEIEVGPDGWTALTRDRKPAAHFEHTVLITDKGPEILTIAKN